ncbi:MAG: hypothetical protein WAV07_06495 [Candidatus Contendobacter sp.]
MLTRWLGEKPATSHVPPATVPTRPQEIKQFERDINRFMQDAATQRGRQADPP